MAEAGARHLIVNIAYVTRENALRFCKGVVDAPWLWTSEAGPVAFVNGLRGALAWRSLARVLQALPPEGLVFASRVPSILNRCEQFGAQLMRVEFREDGYPQYFWFAEGPPLRNFLESILPSQGAFCRESQTIAASETGA
jgi:hypothetical protein